MSQRLDNKIWLWCLLALHVGSVWGTARPVTVRTPPSNPSTIEAQAKFFQYRHLPKADEFDQGHRLGSERHFTERHERAKPSEGLFSAKVRWGDKKGGYGEHYWDLNHAGNADNIGDDGDDGSYRDSHNDDPYDEPSNNAPTYGEEEYDPERSSYEETGRAKRAHPKRTAPKKQNNRERNNNNREQEAAETSHEEEFEDEEEEEKTYEKPKPKRQQYRKKEDDNKQKEKNQIVLVYLPQAPQVPKQHLEPPHFVPYEGGAGVRQHHQPDVTAASTVPRLFLEPSTGHVVDRATGQAYVLQPIAPHNNYN
ncbi:unnamed protein product [Spodoptera littoralis]|uniref:Cuticular protein n=1 Tax=Spodoptera littoralis TaxID=7109 RepID=A0A9P0ICB8_SPOLI|nr:unnamed protein product [Spodoptera littoralis]CAH1644128.1 unnamed protein product [Spodoptera littoralis]